MACASPQVEPACCAAVPCAGASDTLHTGTHARTHTCAHPHTHALDHLLPDNHTDATHGSATEAAADAAHTGPDGRAGGDHPLLSLLRQEWLCWHHRRFTAAFAALMPIPGDSKTMRAVREHGIARGIQGMAARLLHALMRVQPRVVDPLIPCALAGDVERDTVKELVAAGVEQERAEALVRDMCAHMGTAAHACAEARRQLWARVDPAAGSPSAGLPTLGQLHLLRVDPRSLEQLLIVYVPDTALREEFLAPVRGADPLPLDVDFGTVDMPLYDATRVPAISAALARAGIAADGFTAALELNYTHYRKLAMLHLMRSNNGALPSEEDWRSLGLPLERDTAAEAPPQAFLRDLFCVLARYEVFSGNTSGLQGAIPHHVFDVLERHCGVTSECFASPMNCHFPSYCSAFPDTDAPFGSKDSFFEFEPEEGAFEANPPFVNSTMLAMANRMEELLARAAARSKPLLFFVIVPAWTDAYYHKSLENSSYLVATQTARRKEHEYIDGMQHRVQRSTWGANVDSTWFVLATPAAVQQYKFTRLTAGAIRSALRQEALNREAGRTERYFKYTLLR